MKKSFLIVCYFRKKKKNNLLPKIFQAKKPIDTKIFGYFQNLSGFSNFYSTILDPVIQYHQKISSPRDSI